MVSSSVSDWHASVAQRQSSGFVISSTKCRFIVSHIVWDSFMTPETTIGVVDCGSLWRDANVKLNVKASYGQPDAWLVRSASPSSPGEHAFVMASVPSHQ
jgi:hypothetical protein